DRAAAVALIGLAAAALLDAEILLQRRVVGPPAAVGLDVEGDRLACADAVAVEPRAHVRLRRRGPRDGKQEGQRQEHAARGGGGIGHVSAPPRGGAGVRCGNAPGGARRDRRARGAARPRWPVHARAPRWTPAAVRWRRRPRRVPARPPPAHAAWPRAVPGPAP